MNPVGIETFMLRDRTRLAEVVMALAIIAICIAFLVDGWHLKPGVFEPVGSGAVPNTVAGLTIALSLVVLAGFARTESNETADPERGRVAALSSVVLVLYVAALGVGLRYQWATLAYVPLAILAVAPNPRRVLPFALAAGVVLAFGLDYIFRHVLVTDLP